MPIVGGDTRSECGYLGVDPGKAGGLVLIDDTGRILKATAMPDTTDDLLDWLMGVNHHAKTVVAALEKVHSMPKQGVVSSFTFGEGFGQLKMGLAAANIGRTLVDPKTWMKELLIPPRKKTDTSTQWKKRLREFAQSLFPQYSQLITLKTADACLLAEYARRRL